MNLESTKELSVIFSKAIQKFAKVPFSLAFYRVQTRNGCLVAGKKMCLHFMEQGIVVDRLHTVSYICDFANFYDIYGFERSRHFDGGNKALSPIFADRFFVFHQSGVARCSWSKDKENAKFILLNIKGFIKSYNCISYGFVRATTSI